MSVDTMNHIGLPNESNQDKQDNRSQPILKTGSPALDVVLGGGLPRNSLNILTGLPGAGKTIMAQELSFAAAKTGLRVVYFTNVSEAHAKLIAHVRDFDFFVPDLIGSNILIYNITSQVRNKGFQQTLDFIVDTVRSEKIDLIVIDSFRGLKHVVDFAPQNRSAIFDLAARLAMLQCTTVLIGEYTNDEVQTEPEFAVADGIIRLSHTTIGVQERRMLSVIKLRGTSYLSGEHSFAINKRGIDVYPRQESLVTPNYLDEMSGRVSTGIEHLDQMLGGGLLRASSTLLAGAIGTGKTILSLHFLAAGVMAGEPGLMVTFQESPAQLVARAKPFGLGEQLQASSLSHTLFLSPVELNLDYAAARIREMVETHNIRRVVIDSVAELEHAAEELTTLRQLSCLAKRLLSQPWRDLAHDTRDITGVWLRPHRG